MKAANLAAPLLGALTACGSSSGGVVRIAPHT